MKTPAERGPIGAWAYQARDEHAFSVDEVIAKLRERGAGVTPSTLRRRRR